jgi:hypothetical protein
MFSLFRKKSDIERHSDDGIQHIGYADAVKDHLLRVMSEDSWEKLGKILPYVNLVRSAFCAGSTSEEAAFAIIVKAGLLMQPEGETKKITLRAYHELEKGGVDMSSVRMHLGPIIPDLASSEGHLLQTQRAAPDFSKKALASI